METLILKGKPVSSKIKDDLSKRISNLKSKDIIPTLAAIIVGNDSASKLYVSSKAKIFSKLGSYSEIFELSSDIDKGDLINFIQKLNRNNKFHGILLQLPLPKHLDEKEILQTIIQDKDVDGFHPINQGYIMQGNPKFIPCTPLGCLKILHYYNIDIEGKDVVVVGRSNIVGKPIASLLSQNSSYGNATVTLCHTRTKDLSSYYQ